MISTNLFGPQKLSEFAHYTTLWIGFSGGLDSTVLLHAFAKSFLAKKLKVIHINHGLSANAKAWQNHCSDVCQSLNLPLLIKKVQFNRTANIEEQARNARYEVFSSILRENEALILGHHQNDQAETLLLQLFRGAGIDGLAAMAGTKKFAEGFILRPLLNNTRGDLEAYAKKFALSWIEDESNSDSAYSRNFLRNEILPLLEERWPALVSSLARTSQHCSDARLNLDELAFLDCPSLKQGGAILPLNTLIDLNFKRKINVLRVWFKLNNKRLPNTKTINRIISEMIEAASDKEPQINIDDYSLRRFQNKLYFLHLSHLDLDAFYEWLDFPKPIKINSFGIISAKKTEKGLKIPHNAKLEFRFRQGGETIKFRGQTKVIKKLFQDLSIPPWQRNQIPLLYINGVCAAIVGYVISDDFFEDSVESYQIYLSPEL